MLADELQLEWSNGETSPDDGAYSKRELIQAYTEGWGLLRLVGLARRVVAELDVNSDRLPPLLAEYDRGGGVGSPAKNLIFAADGPKPKLVLRVAVNNDIEIVRKRRALPRVRPASSRRRTALHPPHQLVARAGEHSGRCQRPRGRSRAPCAPAGVARHPGAHPAGVPAVRP